MKCLLMGHIERKVSSFIPYDAKAFTMKGVLFGLWAWRNILKMDTYYGPVRSDLLPSNLPAKSMKEFLEDYDMVLVVGWKELNSLSLPNEPDGYNRPAWLKKVAPHLKVALTADFGHSWYEARHFGISHHKRLKMISEQIGSSDVFLQLVWSHIKELREYFGMDHIHTVLPVDFREYAHQFRKINFKKRNKYLIAVTRHNEKTHVNLRETIKISKIIKKLDKRIRIRFFSLNTSNNPEAIKKYWLDNGIDWYFYDEIIPFQIAPKYFESLHECGIFIDSVSICGAGPRFFLNASALKVPSIINTGLGWELLPELSTRKINTRHEKPDYDGYVKHVKRLLNDNDWYKEMSELAYKRLWDRCRGPVAKKQLFKLLGLE